MLTCQMRFSIKIKVKMCQNSSNISMNMFDTKKQNTDAFNNNLRLKYLFGPHFRSVCCG